MELLNHLSYVFYGTFYVGVRSGREEHIKLDKLKHLISLIVVVCSFSSAFAGDNDASSASQATVTILPQNALVKDYDLNFGYILRGATSGTVTVNPDNSRTATGVTLTGSTSSAAQFTAFGIPINHINIKLTNKSFLLTDGQSNTMLVNNLFTSTRQIDRGGVAVEIKVGGTLNVNANQAAGFYQNTTDLEIQVVYH